jgi:hypothetical protein
MADFIFGNTQIGDVFEPSSSLGGNNSSSVLSGYVTGYHSYVSGNLAIPTNTESFVREIARRYKPSEAIEDRISEQTFFNSHLLNDSRDLQTLFQKKNAAAPILTLDGFTVQGHADTFPAGYPAEGQMSVGFFVSRDSDIAVKIKIWYVPAPTSASTWSSLTASLSTAPADEFEVTGSGYTGSVNITTSSGNYWEIDWIGLGSGSTSVGCRLNLFNGDDNCISSSLSKQQFRVSVSKIPELTYSGEMGNCSVRCKSIPEFPIGLQLTGSYGELAYVRVMNLTAGTASLSSSFTSEQVLFLDGQIADTNPYGKVLVSSAAPVCQFYNNTTSSMVYLLDVSDVYQGVYDTIGAFGVIKSCDTSSVATGSNPTPSGSGTSLQFLGDSTNAAFEASAWLFGSAVGTNTAPSPTALRNNYKVYGITSNFDPSFQLMFELTDSVPGNTISSPVTATFTSAAGLTSSIIPTGTTMFQFGPIDNSLLVDSGSFTMSLSMGNVNHWNAITTRVYKYAGTGILSHAGLAGTSDNANGAGGTAGVLLSNNHNFGIAKQIASFNRSAGGYTDSFRNHGGSVDGIDFSISQSLSNHQVLNPSLQSAVARNSVGFTSYELVMSGFVSSSVPASLPLGLNVYPSNGPGPTEGDGTYQTRTPSIPITGSNEDGNFEFEQWDAPAWVQIDNQYSSEANVLNHDGFGVVNVAAVYRYIGYDPYGYN